MDFKFDQKEIDTNNFDSKSRNNNISEVFFTKPDFITRWALILFLLIMIFILIGTWFIKYPDIIKTNAKLVSNNAPKELIVKQEGRLIKMFYKNNEFIKKGNTIGYIECNANHDQILKLKSLLGKTITDLQCFNFETVNGRFDNNYDSLGELQDNYEKFKVSYQLYIDYLQNGFYSNKKYKLLQDYKSLLKSNDILLQQNDYLNKDLALSEESFYANNLLFNEKVISKQEIRNEQSRLLLKKLTIPQVKNLLLNNENDKRNKLYEIEELEHNYSLQKFNFIQETTNLYNIINEWENKYLVRAPVSGKILFLLPLQENFFLRNGMLIGYINPNNPEFYADIIFRQLNFGKISKGQTVQLRLDAYPYQEFGYLPGKITFISDIATDSGYIGQVQINSNLTTNRNIKIHYNEGMKGEAYILTNEKRLLERFYQNILIHISR